MSAMSSKVGQRVRITSQLIDAATGTHLWAERYDHELTDIFAVQDEITSRVVVAIEPALSHAESQRGAAKRPEHMGAWDYCQRGFWHLNKLTATDGAAAYGLFKTAVALDPNLAEAHLGLARALIVQWEYGSIEELAPSVREARESAIQAAALDGENPYAQYVLAQTSHWAGDVGAAIAYASRAIELNGNFALGHFYLGIALSLDGRHEEALEALETGLRLSPRDPRASTWLANKARVLITCDATRRRSKLPRQLAASNLTRTALSFWSRAAPNSGATKRLQPYLPRYAACQVAAPKSRAGIWIDIPTRPRVSIWLKVCARQAFSSNDGFHSPRRISPSQMLNGKMGCRDVQFPRLCHVRHTDRGRKPPCST
jgi:Tetratricopeptide repeat